MKNKTINLRVSSDEYEYIKKQADVRGVSISTWIRDKCKENHGRSVILESNFRNALLNINMGLSQVEDNYQNQEDIKLIREGVKNLWQCLK